MDSREIHQQQQQQQQQQQPPPGFFNRNPNTVMHHHQRLPFGSLSPHQPQYHHQHQHQHHHPQVQQQIDQKTLESLGFEGSPSSTRFGIGEQQQQQVKKKRGRPRKYAPDGNIALALAPTSPASNSFVGGGGGGTDTAGDNVDNSSDPPAKRNRGRPPGSGKKQLDALGGMGGVGFTPHVIEVQSGEDIALKVRAFSQQGPRAICILSATGAVSSVMLRQASNSNGAIQQHEGRYEIISLSGSFLNTESNGTVTKTGNLSVSLAGQDGRIIGGSVAGTLVAGSQVQVIVGSFVPDVKKQKQSTPVARTQNNPEPASAPANMLSFGGNGGTGSPRSQGQQHSSESSEENESNSSLPHVSNNNNNNHGLFANSTPQQPLQQMPMHMWWAGSGHGHGHGHSDQ